LYSPESSTLPSPTIASFTSSRMGKPNHIQEIIKLERDNRYQENRKKGQQKKEFTRHRKSNLIYPHFWWGAAQSENFGLQGFIVGLQGLHLELQG